jgi:hypothetical protein
MSHDLTICTGCALMLLTVGMGARSGEPKDGYVPDAATAARIAEAVLLPIYGEATVLSERPFKASLNDDVWTVTGSMKKVHPGGVATVRLSKADGRVLFVTHGK